MTPIRDFRKELLVILNGASIDITLQDDDKCFKSILAPKSISYPNEIATNYGKMLRILRVISDKSNNPISDTELENKLDNFIIELKYRKDQKSVRREIDNHIVNFIKSLKIIKSDKFLFLIPIMNLNIQGFMQIGCSSIVTLTEELVRSLEKKYSMEFGYGLHGSEPIKQLRESNETETYGIVTVDAPDNEKAIELAIQKAETCLNILRVYSDTWNFVLRRDLKKTFGIRLIQANLNTKKYGVCSRSVNLQGNLAPTTLTKKGLENYNLKIKPVIDVLLSKPGRELTSLQKDLLTAIMWFGNAVKDDEKNMRFVKGIMALETLLVPNGGKAKCDVIAKNFVRIVFSGASKEKKSAAYKEMKEMYRIRSSIIHSGDGYVYKEDILKMLAWVRITIQVLLEKANQYENLSEVLSKEFPS